MSTIKDIVKGLCEKTKCYFDVYTKHYVDKNIYTKEEVEEKLSMMNNKIGGKSDNGHTHNQILDIAKNQKTTFAYSKDDYDNPDYFAVWNGYELRTLSRNKIADQIGAVVKGDFAVITGTLEEDTTNGWFSKTLSLPSGFNKGNSVIVSVMTQNPSKTEWVIGTIFNSSSYVLGGLPTMVDITDSNLTIRVRRINLISNEPVNVGNGAPYNFKIVLMKV